MLAEQMLPEQMLRAETPERTERIFLFRTDRKSSPCETVFTPPREELCFYAGMYAGINDPTFPTQYRL